MQFIFHILILILFLIQTGCKRNTYFVKYESHPKELKEINETDSIVESIIAPYKKEIGDDLNTVIADVRKDLILKKPVSSLGNFMVDLSYEMTKKYLNKKIDFGFLNYGGIRIPVLPKGQLKKGKVFELMPFENHLVAVEINGKELMNLFNHIADNGGWPVSNNVKIVIQANKAVDVKIDGVEIDMRKKYLVSTIDYLANGGDKCSFLKDKKQIHTGVLLRDAIIENVVEKNKQGMKLDADEDDRIFILK